LKYAALISPENTLKFRQNLEKFDRIYGGTSSYLGKWKNIRANICFPPSPQKKLFSPSYGYGNFISFRKYSLPNGA